MKKFRFYTGALVFLFFISSFFGCASYKFHHGQPPLDKGYVVSRDDYTIAEYTIGQDFTVPDRKLAKERFLRRRHMVEDYYKKMGYIENHFRMAVYDPATMFLKLFGGIFRLPFIAISDYKYDHNSEYRQKIQKIEAENDARKENRIKDLKEKLNAYVQKDLSKEAPVPKPIVLLPEATKENTITLPKEEVAATLSKEEVPAKTENLLLKEPEEKNLLPSEKATVQEVEPAGSTGAGAMILEPEVKPEPAPLVQEPAVSTIVTEKPVLIEKTLQEVEKKQDLPSGLSTVIIARPLKGYSPLKVNFYGNKSRSPKGRIVSYFWEFGDGDTSGKPNPVNTYYSSSLEPKKFNVTLTVKDNKGNTAMAATEIEVLNK